MEYKDVCEFNNEFLVITNLDRNSWFYSIVGSIPTMNYSVRDKSEIYKPNTSFYYWNQLDNYRCAIYYNDGGNLVFSRDEYDVLYENDSGLILMKK